MVVSDLYVSTRKGLFHVDRTAGRWKPTRVDFLGSPVSLMLDNPHDGCLYAALELGHFGAKLHRSEDQGKSWTEVGVPAYPAAAEGEDAPKLVKFWSLEGGSDGVLWAGTIPGGLFRSTDRGATWQLDENLWNMPERAKWFGGGADAPGIHSICIHPNDPNNVMIGVSCGGAWLTPDGGKSWEIRAQGMYADYMPPEGRFEQNAQDPHRIVQCKSSPDSLWCQHHNGIFRSTNAGREWTSIENVSPSKFGFGVAVHPNDPETAWFVPATKDELRIPVNGAVVVNRTRDGGKSFETLREGLPQEDAYDLIYRHAFAIDGTGARLAFGSTTGGLWVTENGGDSWSLVSAHLPPIYAVRFSS